MSSLVSALAGGLCAVGATVCLLIALRVRKGGPAGGGLRSKEARQMARAEGVRMLGALMRPQSTSEMDALKQRLVRAGYYGVDHLDMFLTIRLSLLIGGLLLGLVIFGLFSSDLVIALGAGAGVVGLFNAAPNSFLRSREQERRQGLIATALPPALDLLVVCLEAGLGLEQALERVAREERARRRDEVLLVSELGIVLADMRVGMSVERAFRRFAERIGGEETNNVVSAITRAASTGAKLAGMLRAHADGTRRRRLTELEEASGKANARLALPLTLLLMPSALVVVAGPSFLSLLGSF